MDPMWYSNIVLGTWKRKKRDKYFKNTKCDKCMHRWIPFGIKAFVLVIWKAKYVITNLGISRGIHALGIPNGIHGSHLVFKHL